MGTHLARGFAVIFDGWSDGTGYPHLGPLRFPVPKAMPDGRVKVSVRPEAWVIEPSGDATALAAKLLKRTYLGNVMEYTLVTELGDILIHVFLHYLKFTCSDIYNFRLF